MIFNLPSTTLYLIAFLDQIADYMLQVLDITIYLKVIRYLHLERWVLALLWAK